MHLELTPLRVLVYAALTAHAASGTLLLRGRHRAGRFLYGGGFVLAVAAFAVRWVQVGHLPLDSLFGVFLWPSGLDAQEEGQQVSTLHDSVAGGICHVTSSSV